MNILQAKEEIKHTILAYLMKDEFGCYKIPEVRQRPVLLMGPPGIGKTAIMSQIAKECNIGLVSYTITHHTRQSAIGLPFILKKNYGGKAYSVTEYTMSEIIASVYEQIEKTGLKEGILFIDEINCVSETLAPTMLQFLQGKTFGNHKVPEGWIIAAAGNPPEYNKSVRPFDIVTLDRVKRIDIQEDFNVWKSYGYSHHIHGAVMTYLEIKKENFYCVEMTVDGKRFVTARGWEDLSEMMKAYESLNIPVTEAMIIQYVQHPKIARDFANYYDLYKKYETSYDVEALLSGNISEKMIRQIQEASFDEKVSVIGLMVSRLNEAFIEAYRIDRLTEYLYEKLKTLKSEISDNTDVARFMALLDQTASLAESERNLLEQRGQLDKDTGWVLHKANALLKDYVHCASLVDGSQWQDRFECVKVKFNETVSNREEIMEHTAKMLDCGFVFLEKAFGESQEMVIFLTELNTDSYCLKFIQDNGCEKYYQYNQSLLFGEKRREILNNISNMMM